MKKKKTELASNFSACVIAEFIRYNISNLALRLLLTATVVIE